MAAPWIVTSKLLAPTLPADRLPRALPGASPLPPVAVLCAGPGYGKTLAMRALADAAPPGAFLLWYGLDADDADPVGCFHHLIAGMERLVPGFGEDLRPLLAGPVDVRLVWRRFFQAVAAYNPPALVLALDDVHHLAPGEGDVLRALAYHFDKLPPRVHVLLTSRRRLPVALAGLRARGIVAAYGPAELKFSPAEAQAFLAARAPAGPLPVAWTQGLEALDGWPLGLTLLARRPADAPWEPGAPAGDADALTAYVAEELVAAQPAELRAFMGRAALLDELDAEACRAVFGDADAEDLLAELAVQHLVQPLDAAGAFRFPAYLRAWLLAAGWPAPEERRALHRKAAAWLGGRGRGDRAIPHWIGAGAWPEAVSACAAHFPALDATGRRALVRRWLAAFPTEVVAGEPALLFWRGRMLARAGQLAPAIADLEAARQGFAARDDAAGELKALVRLATLALYAGDRPRFGQLLLRAQAFLGQGHAEDVADFHLARALAAEQRGDLSLMAECNQAVLALPVGTNAEVAACHALAAMNLYTLAWHLGDLAAAHRHVARALDVAAAWGLHGPASVAGFLQAHLWLSEGEPARAEAFVRSLPPHWEDVLDWHNRGLAYTVRGHLDQARGAWKEAEEWLRRALTSFERAGYAEGRLVPLERLAWLALARKQHERLEALTADVAADAASVQALALVVPRARGRHLRGEPEAAIAALEAAIPALEGLRADLHVARARLVEAAARLGAGQPQAAAQAHQAAMRLVEARGYGFLLEQDPQLREDLRSLQGAPSAPEGQAGLAVRCLGGFEARVGGGLVERWPRRKPQAILVALLLHPAGLAPADLAFVLGAASFTTAVMRTLQADVSALRRLLEPALERGERSRYVRLVGERYQVPEDVVEAFDWRALEAALARGERRRDADPGGAAADFTAALGLYRGPLVEDGPFAGLFEAEREQARQRVGRALTWLADHHRAAGDAAAAEAALRRAIALAPCDEEPYLALLRHERAMGRGDRLRQIYWDGRKALQRHLGLAPSEAFEAAFRDATSG